MAEGKSAAMPFRSFNPNKAWLDLQNEVHYVKAINPQKVCTHKLHNPFFILIVSTFFGSANFILFLYFRCKCEFYYVAYGESSLEGVTDRLPRRPEINPWSAGDREHFVNAFRFRS